MPSQVRTVRFFEIVDHKTGGAIPDLPWTDVLDNLGKASISPHDRTVEIKGDDHHGGPWTMSGHPSMLLFSRIRGSFEFPDLIDRRSGELEALTIAETKGVAETTHVGFFPSNVVAMVRSRTSPGATSLQRWINAMGLFEDPAPLDVQPLTRASVTQRINDVERARGVSVRVRSTAGQALADRAPRMADVIDVLQQQFGSVMVEMRIYTVGDQGETPESAALFAEAEGLLALTATGEVQDHIKAARMTYLSREKERDDEIDMLNEKLAERVEVETVDDEGKAAKRESAAIAMQVAYNHLRDDIEAALHGPIQQAGGTQ